MKVEVEGSDLSYQENKSGMNVDVNDNDELTASNCLNLWEVMTDGFEGYTNPGN